MRFSGKTVVVTGASSGIGRLAALTFAKGGANVGLIARSGDGLGTLAAEIREVGGRSFSFMGDVSDFDAIKRGAHDIAEQFGGIDIWINNAAVAVYAEARDTSLPDLRRVMDVNFFGQVHGVLAALPYLEKSGGQIIATLSVDSEIGIPFHSAYAASKHALYGYYKVLHEELLHHHSSVRVSTILPASIATPFFEHAKTQLGVRPKPLGAVYSPELVVDAMLEVAENLKFSTVVGGTGRRYLFLYRRFPNFFYWLHSRFAFDLQKTDEPKLPDDFSNLYAPVPQSSRVMGKDKPSPVANFMETGGRKYVLGLVGALGAGLYAYRRYSAGNRFKRWETIPEGGTYKIA